MKRAYLAVAIFAACAALAAGQAKLCENSRAPGEVSDTRILSNTYDAGSKTSKLQLQWTSPVKNPGSGCVDGYTVEIFDGARKVGSDNVPGSPSLKTVQHTVAANPGATVTFKVVAKNSGTGKQSSPVTVIPSSFKAAPAPPTQGVKPPVNIPDVQQRLNVQRPHEGVDHGCAQTGSVLGEVSGGYRSTCA